MRVKARVKDKKLVSEKRRLIIDGAIKVFKKKGYHKATIREIAEEAKISPGSVYDYFHSKDDILYLFFDNYARAFFEKLGSLTPRSDDPSERLEVAYRAVLDVLLESSVAPFDAPPEMTGATSRAPGWNARIPRSALMSATDRETQAVPKMRAGFSSMQR